MQVCRFWLEKPGECVAVHCTHGINRTGFFVVTYLVECCGMHVEEAIAAFAAARSPGIWDRR